MTNQAPPKSNLLDSPHKKFQPENLASIFLTSVVIGAAEVLVVISLAALVFSGPLAEFAPRGIGLWLIGGMVIGIINTLRSSYRGAVAGPQDSSAAVMAVLATAIVVKMTGQFDIEVTFYTVLGALTVSTLFTGIIFYFLGRYKLGNLIRFIPYPVIGGFLAGSGWLLVMGAFNVMIDFPSDLTDIGTLFEPGLLLRWLPPLLFGLLIVVLLRRIKHHLAFPLLLICSVSIFYLILFVSGTSLSEASANSWILGGEDQIITWQPLIPSGLGKVNWGAIIEQGGAIFTVMVTSLVGMLLNASGLEVVARKPVDINHELRTSGLANLLSGILSGPVGYSTITLSLLGVRLGIESRLLGLLCAGMYGAALIFGASFLAYFPTPVMAVLLFYFGISFLTDWLYDGWRKLSKTDYALVVSILIIVAFIGFLQGIVVGFVLAILIFVVNYSRVDIVINQLNGLTYRSRVERRKEFLDILDDRGLEFHILKLRGYLFFGTASSLLQRIRKRVNDAEQVRPKFVILDFYRVTALDSSALNSFILMREFAKENDFSLILTDVSKDIQKMFLSEGIDPAQDRHLHFFKDLDHGMEWCEEQLFRAHSLEEPTIVKRLEEALTEELEVKPKIDFTKLGSYFEMLKVDSPTIIIEQGMSPEALYFLEEGELTIQLEQDSGDVIRLGKLEAGAIVGEMQVYSKTPASAYVQVTRPSTVYKLSLEALERMEHEAPELAAAFHKHIAKLLGKKLFRETAMLDAIMK
jgi:SulP family sulfate permease